jgi:hypothetical protein
MKYIQECSNEILDCPCGSGFENCDCQENFFNPDDCDICGCDPCNCFDDVCCFDPRYTGEPGSCHCKDYAEQMELESTFKYKLNHWIKNRQYSFLTFISVSFEHLKYYLYFKWVDVKREIESDDDLPF